MKNILLCSLSILFLFTSCGNTINSYNDTIVVAHDKLIEINKDFTSKFQSYIGKPEKREAFKKYLKETKEKLYEARKPVDELVEIKDAGFRKGCLELFDTYETLLLTFNLKAEIITNTGYETVSLALFINEFEKIDAAEKELIQIQYRYAEMNNAHM